VTERNQGFSLKRVRRKISGGWLLSRCGSVRECRVREKGAVGIKEKLQIESKPRAGQA